MAAYTPDYQLHQRAGSGKFLRTDFNQDFKSSAVIVEQADKTQTAVLQAQVNAKAEEASVDSRFSAVDSRLTTLNSALTTQQNRTCFKAGTYVGNGAASQFISLGFKPTAVVVECVNGSRASTGGSDVYGGNYVDSKVVALVFFGLSRIKAVHVANVAHSASYGNGLARKDYVHVIHSACESILGLILAHGTPESSKSLALNHLEFGLLRLNVAARNNHLAFANSEGLAGNGYRLALCVLTFAEHQSPGGQVARHLQGIGAVDLGLVHAADALGLKMAVHSDGHSVFAVSNGGHVAKGHGVAFGNGNSLFSLDSALNLELRCATVQLLQGNRALKVLLDSNLAAVHGQAAGDGFRGDGAAVGGHAAGDSADSGSTFVLNNEVGLHSALNSQAGRVLASDSNSGILSVRSGGGVVVADLDDAFIGGVSLGGVVAADSNGALVGGFSIGSIGPV